MRKYAKRIITAMLCIAMAVSMAMPVSAACKCHTVTTTVSNSAAYISKESATVMTGCTLYLTVYKNKKAVAWSSSDPSVAAVTKYGRSTARITGKKAGTAVITATVDGKSLTCTVTVASRTKPASLIIKTDLDEVSCAGDVRKNDIKVYVRYNDGTMRRSTRYAVQFKYKESKYSKAKIPYIHVTDKATGLTRDARIHNGTVTYVSYTSSASTSYSASSSGVAYSRSVTESLNYKLTY